MRFTSKGIGWLIAGAIIAASAVDSDSLSSAAGTLLFGLVFAAVYVIKQFFDPKGTGWFIAGGIMLAFSVETMLGVTGGILKNSFLDRGDLSTTLIGLIIACACLFAFYRNNKHAVDHLASQAGIEMPQTGYEEPAAVHHDAPVVEPEPAAGPATGQAGAAPASGAAAAGQTAPAPVVEEVTREGSDVEFELKTEKEIIPDGPDDADGSEAGNLQ